MNKLEVTCSPQPVLEDRIDKDIGPNRIIYKFDCNTITFIVVDLMTMIMGGEITYEYSKETDEMNCTVYRGAIVDSLLRLEDNKNKSVDEVLEPYLANYGESKESLKDKLVLYMTRGMTNDLITSCNGSV